MAGQLFMAEARVERRLAAILAAEVAGYSRLMGADEEGTLAALKAHRREIVDPKIAEYRGRIVKTTGDGALVEFGSAVDAVRCALEIQQRMAERNSTVTDDRRIEFRIGINIGDVIIDEGDVFGDGVNIAARLEALANPGSVCIVDSAYRQIEGKVPVNVADLGEQQLKNIARPVRVCELRMGEAAVPRAALTPPDKPSIAVLPFTNMSEPDQEYFSDGITEDIITGLACFRSLFVIARNSSFAFRGKPTSLAEIGRQLGVAYLVEGSIRRAGERVRVTAQLLEADTGMHIWTDRYDRGLEDIFAVQEEVARTIVSTLVGRIDDARLQKSLRRPPASLAAYDCLLRGLARYRGFAKEDNQK
ncbi:MAG: adenylate/guanylate cyclase domain-containing protein, partial [Pseudolabrys sp.]